MNIRATLISFAVLLAVLVAPTAGAVEVSIVGPTSATIVPGGSFTIDIALDNASLDNTPGFEVRVDGMVAAGASVTGGQSATIFLVQACLDPFGCLNGINSIDNAFYDPSDLSANSTPGDDSLLAINVAGATFSANSGVADPGLTGAAPDWVHDPIDATINFIADTAGVHVLTIGGEWSDGVDVFTIPSSTFTLTVPEPGAMAASLAGLGTVFAVVGIRRRR